MRRWLAQGGLRPRELPMRQQAGAFAVGLTLALGATLDITGALHVYGLGALMGQKLALGAGMVLVGIAGGWVLVASLPTPAGEGAYGQETATHRRLLTLLMLAAWLATGRSVLIFLAPHASRLEQLWFFLGAWALAAAALRPPRAGPLTLLALILGLGARLICIRHLALDPRQSDMLPLVERAISNLRAGQSPYTIYRMPWELPLTYLPATWLAYLPAQLAGLDLRLTNLLAELIIGGVIVWLSVGGKAEPRQMGGLLWAWVFLQPSVLSWSLTTTAPIWWALLAVTLALIIQRRRGVWLALGLGAAASPYAAVAWPFALLFLARRDGIAQTARSVAAAGLCAALLIGPFLLWDAEMFSFGVWRWFNQLELFPRLRWELDNTWASMVGFAGVFWRRQLEFLLKPIQAAIMAALLIRFWRRPITPAGLAAYVSAATLLFSVFNPVLWPYLYNHGLIAALVATGAVLRQPGRAGASTVRPT